MEKQPVEISARDRKSAIRSFCEPKALKIPKAHYRVDKSLILAHILSRKFHSHKEIRISLKN
jgi:hypothetical protein